MRLRLFLLLLIAASIGAQSKLTPVSDAGYSKILAAHKGKVVLVNFWATWCKPCREEMPELVKLAGRLQARGFDMVLISADEPESEGEAMKVLLENKVTGQPYIKRVENDDKFIGSIDAKWSGALPASFLYDRTGKKIRSFVGETSAKDLEAAIQKLL